MRAFLITEYCIFSCLFLCPSPVVRSNLCVFFFIHLLDLPFLPNKSPLFVLPPLLPPSCPLAVCRSYENLFSGLPPHVLTKYVVICHLPNDARKQLYNRMIIKAPKTTNKKKTWLVIGMFGLYNFSIRTLSRLENLHLHLITLNVAIYLFKLMERDNYDIAYCQEGSRNIFYITLYYCASPSFQKSHFCSDVPKSIAEEVFFWRKYLQ